MRIATFESSFSVVLSSPVIPLSGWLRDSAGSGTRNEFYQELLGKSDMDMKMYWSTTIFTGAGVPPKAMGNDKEVVKFVEENPGSIGYVDSASTGTGVKVVLTVK